MRTSKVQRAAGFLAIACGLTVCATAAAGAGATVPQEAIQKIRQAAPDRPRVEPKKPRRLLIFTRCQGFTHGVIPLGSKALQILGEKTGAYETVVSDDMSVFEPENLKKFDAVCLNNTTLRAPGPESLLEFVRRGKGVVGVHAATDAYYKWPEYGEMMGGYFDGHPWHEEVAVRVEEPNHPLCAGFEEEVFSVVDEIYQFRNPYSHEKLRVLLSLDPEGTNMDKDAIKREDGDFAVTWLNNYGAGRVFYCSLGHDNHIFWTPSILQHYLDGIQFAMGDLPADTTPSAVERPRYSADWEGVATTSDGTRIRIGAQVIARGGSKYMVKVYEDFDVTQPPVAALEARISDGRIEMEGQSDEGHIRATGEISKVRMTGEFRGAAVGEFWMNKVVRPSPTMGLKPPEGAVVLFGGTGTDQWQHMNGKPCKWKLVGENAMQVVPGTGSIISKKKFTDQRIHVEFATPFKPKARGQGRGNSGVYVQNLYEVQVLDSYGLAGRNNECGGIYHIAAPKVNMCAPPMRWQTYDIIFHAPRFDEDGNKVKDARMTVFHNGVKVHDNVNVSHATGSHEGRDIHGGGPLYLQDHGNRVRYRNIWVKEL